MTPLKSSAPRIKPRQNAEKPLQAMFGKVQPRYDLLNRLIPLGLASDWRRRAARELLRQRPCRVLDLGCGTGDLSLEAARLAGSEICITGVDFSPPMLNAARQKAGIAGLGGRVSFVEADAARLPFPDGHFDATGLAFSFRNLTWRNPRAGLHVAEMLRTLRKGGRLITVESSQPRNRLLRALFHGYMRNAAAACGALLSDAGAYRYLAESACRFMPPEEVSGLLLSAGFTSVTFRGILGGIAAIHIARK